MRMVLAAVMFTVHEAAGEKALVSYAPIGHRSRAHSSLAKTHCATTTFLLTISGVQLMGNLHPTRTDSFAKYAHSFNS